MWVIKSGDPKRVEGRRLYWCDECGCCFVASRHEYVAVYQGSEATWRAVCPCCGHAVCGGKAVEAPERSEG